MGRIDNKEIKRHVEPVKLRLKDWEEIYAALDHKRSRLERGEYGPMDDPEVDVLAWIAHVNWILTAIGPDGETAARRGVAPS